MPLISKEIPINPEWVDKIAIINDKTEGCQIFLPLPKRMHDEGVDHYQQKIRVAMTVQAELTALFTRNKKGSGVMTIEHTFTQAKEPIHDNPYIADIFVRTYGDNGMNRFSIEIDGKKGHGSIWKQTKNKIRDDIITEKENTKVIRIPLSLLTGVKTHPYRSITGRSFSITPMSDTEIIDFLNEKLGDNLGLNK